MIDPALARDLLAHRATAPDPLAAAVDDPAWGLRDRPDPRTYKCPNGCTVTTAPDLPPLDLHVDYGREALRARADAVWRTGGDCPVPIKAIRGRPVRTVDVPFWTAPTGYCVWCGHPIEEFTKAGARRRQRRWHQPCADAYLALGSQQGFRAAIWTRDRGVCAECLPGTPPCRRFPQGRPTASVDAYGRRGTGSEVPRGDEAHFARYYGRSDCQVPGCVGEAVHLRLREVEGPIDDREWHADHVVPLWAGGAHDLSNGQTLCDRHHKAKTRREAGERALARRLARGAEGVSRTF